MESAPLSKPSGWITGSYGGREGEAPCPASQTQNIKGFQKVPDPLGHLNLANVGTNHGAKATIYKVELSVCDMDRAYSETPN